VEEKYIEQAMREPLTVSFPMRALDQQGAFKSHEASTKMLDLKEDDSVPFLLKEKIAADEAQTGDDCSTRITSLLVRLSAVKSLPRALI
jgi:hypothetical protein